MYYVDHVSKSDLYLAISPRNTSAPAIPYAATDRVAPTVPELLGSHCFNSVSIIDIETMAEFPLQEISLLSESCQMLRSSFQGRLRGE